MIIKPGAVYNQRTIDFIAAIEHIDCDALQVKVRLINIINWVVLQGFSGKQLASGQIDVPNLEAEFIAPNITSYLVAKAKAAKKKATAAS